MRILTIIILSFFVLLSATAQAKMDKKTIPCLSIDKIHEIAPLMKDADIDKSSNRLYQAQISIVDNGLFWFIMSHNLVANSKDEAAELAQKRSASVTNMVYPYTRKGPLRNDEYGCLYYDNSISKLFVSIIAILKEYP